MPNKTPQNALRQRQSRQGAAAVLGFCLSLLVYICAILMEKPLPLIANASAASARSADDFLVVDCLLPGQVRRLGQMMTYLAPRQAIKTTAMDCQIRGGEYAAEDRGNYAAALKVWLPLATAGDKAAQTYVGEIYEKGLGVPPDYAQAASWYRKAAEQGYSRAQLNYGFLQEKGLGVSKNPSEALVWYRKASGLSGGIALETHETQALRQEVLQSKRTEESLRQELEQTQQQLEKARRNLQRRKSQTDAEERRWEGSRRELEQQQAKATDQPRINKLKDQLARREAELARQRKEVQRLTAETERHQSRLNSLEGQQETPSAPSQTATVGPKIELIEPMVSAMRGLSAPTVRTRPGLNQRAIVGKVSSPAGIVSLIVNDREEKLDSQGLFRTHIPLTRSRTPVTVVAVDREGKRTSLDFTFVPDNLRDEETSAALATKSPEINTSPPLSPLGDVGAYYALVIGNNDYQHLPKLGTAVNDAKAIAAVLTRKYRFKTTTLLNASRYQILSALSELRGKLTEKDNLFVYYAGHGELDRVNRRGHWLPVDAERESTANWISNIDITDTLNVMSARHVLVVADSCYSGTLTRSSLAQLNAGMNPDARDNLYKSMTKKRSRTVLTSGGLVPVPDAGGGDHSVFAKALLDALEANNQVVEGARLYREVAARVTASANHSRVEQAPEYAPMKYAGHEFGDFFFVPLYSEASLPSPTFFAVN
jgi:uncharacterized caspase-like protein